MSRWVDGYELERIQRLLAKRHQNYVHDRININRVLVVDHYVSDDTEYYGPVYVVLHGDPDWVTTIIETEKGLEVAVDTNNKHQDKP